MTGLKFTEGTGLKESGIDAFKKTESKQQRAAITRELW